MNVLPNFALKVLDHTNVLGKVLLNRHKKSNDSLNTYLHITKGVEPEAATFLLWLLHFYPSLV